MISYRFFDDFPLKFNLCLNTDQVVAIIVRLIDKKTYNTVFLKDDDFEPSLCSYLAARVVKIKVPLEIKVLSDKLLPTEKLLLRIDKSVVM